jgi:hypothetical protein
MKYESTIIYHSKDMANVKVFKKLIKLRQEAKKMTQ